MSVLPASLAIVRTTSVQAARDVAGEIAALIRERVTVGRAVVLGLATGRTPLDVYDELARRHREEALSFANVMTFNLDEYLGLAPDDPRSFQSYMRARLFERVGLAPGRTWLPASDTPAARIDEHCREYERRIADAGGLDLQILGIGRNGHIGFNEPGSPRESRTREVALDRITRDDAAATFGGLERVPTHAITMGIATILDARRIRVLAFGEHKREIVQRVLTEPIGPALPATYLREHRDAVLYAGPEVLAGIQ